MQQLGIADNDCVGVREDKTCEVVDGIRVIVLGNFVESLERPEINVLHQCLNIHCRDIYARLFSRSTQQSNVYLPQKRDTISNFYQKCSQISPMSNVMFVSDRFNEVSSTTNCKSIDMYATVEKLQIFVKTIKMFLYVLYCNCLFQNFIKRNMNKNKNSVD